MTLIAIFVVLVFGYSLVSGWLSRTVMTAPIMFTAAGALSLVLFPSLDRAGGNRELFLHLAEVGLVLLLFTDASRTHLTILRSIKNIPTRLLSVGMLLTIALGMLAAKAILPGLSVWEAGILAAILAPTDAGLGQIIVNDSRVPNRIRQALNVEAGLNDGLAVPFLLFFMALAGIGAESQEASLMRFIVEQLVYGTAIGVVVGALGGYLIGYTSARGLVAESWQRLGVVALPLLCMLGCEQVGASMFIASFVAGLAVQLGFKEAGKHSVEFTEEWGQLLNLTVFLLFGLLLARNWQNFEALHVLYAILSLTVIRMLPVALALRGTGLSRATVIFMGWFGPRGLASIVLALVYLEGVHKPTELTVLLTVMVTVGFSILAHGLSAVSGIRMYADSVKHLPAQAPELREVS